MSVGSLGSDLSMIGTSSFGAAPDMDFCRRLPKVEVSEPSSSSPSSSPTDPTRLQLHAHLTGSITRETLQKIWVQRTVTEGPLGIEPPMKALADPSDAQAIDT